MNRRQQYRHGTETAVIVALALVALVIYFSPLSISQRQRSALLHFPEDRYFSAEQSERFRVNLTITINELPDSEHSQALLEANMILNMNNSSTQTVRDFRWAGAMDQSLLGYLSIIPPVNLFLNDPGVYGSYKMLWSSISRLKLDLLPEGTLPSHSQDNARAETISIIHGDRKVFDVTRQTEGSLEDLLEALARPVKLKLIHEGGTEYVTVTPVIINQLSTGYR